MKKENLCRYQELFPCSAKDNPDKQKRCRHYVKRFAVEKSVCRHLADITGFCQNDRAKEEAKQEN